MSMIQTKPLMANAYAPQAPSWGRSTMVSMAQPPIIPASFSGWSAPATTEGFTSSQAMGVGVQGLPYGLVGLNTAPLNFAAADHSQNPFLAGNSRPYTSSATPPAFGGIPPWMATARNTVKVSPPEPALFDHRAMLPPWSQGLTTTSMPEVQNTSFAYTPGNGRASWFSQAADSTPNPFQNSFSGYGASVPSLATANRATVTEAVTSSQEQTLLNELKPTALTKDQSDRYAKIEQSVRVFLNNLTGA